MKIKMIGILVCMLLIATALPVIGMIEDTEKQQSMTDDGPSKGIWFVRGRFKYLDEDEDYIYLNAMIATLRGFFINGGTAAYHMISCPIKITKPFYGILPHGSIPLLGIGICNEWDYNI